MESSYDRLMADKSVLPYRMFYLTDWMIKKAEEELNETEENRAQALEKLRILIAKERNLDIWTDDSYLLQFLRAGKLEPKRAMEMIRNLYTMLKDFPDVYSRHFDTETANSLIENKAGEFNPYRHKDGGVIFFIKAANWDPEQIPAELVVTAMTAMALSFAEDPATQVCGVHLIYDAEFNVKHLRAATPRYMRFYSRILRNTLPIRINTIHVVNESAIFRYLFNILKIFLSEKIKNRFHFHGSDMKQLHKYIPKEILPREYGGDNVNYSSSEFTKNEFSPFLEKYNKMLDKGYL